MAYTKHNFKSGDKLFASQLNEMDEQISANVDEITRLNAQLERATIEPADSVEWLEANGDKGKKYYLPDGYEYAWMEKLVDVVHNANDGTCVENARPAADSAITTAPVTVGAGTTGNLTTAPIALDKTQSNHKINLSGLAMLYTNYYTPCYVFYYGADGAWIGYENVRDLNVSPSIVDGTLTLPASFDVSKDKNNRFASATQIRLMIGVKLNTKIYPADYASLVINCEWLNSKDYVWNWYSTGTQHSNDKATQQNTVDIGILQERTGNLESRTSELETDVATLMDGGLVSTATGQVLYAVGDSITYGYGVGGNSHSWVHHVIDRNGYDSTKCLNLGQSGLGFCTNAMSGDSLTDVLERTDFSEADIVTVALGINDWKNDNALLTDFWTGMEECFTKIRTDNPYCKIFYILPFNARFLGTFDTFYCLGSVGSGNQERPYAYTLQTFINMIKAKFDEDAFKSFHVHVIDMVECPAINRYNMTSADTFIDSIHPSAECHKELAKEIARRIALA